MLWSRSDCDAPCASIRRARIEELVMGDKGGKKDKSKSQKQNDKKVKDKARAVQARVPQKRP